MAYLAGGLARSAGQSAASTLQASLIAHRGPLAIVALHLVAAHALASALGMTVEHRMVSTMALLGTLLLPAFFLAWLVVEFFIMALRDRPDRPLKRFAARIGGTLGDTRGMIDGLVALATIVLLMKAFSLVKDAIPLANPFGWDTTFAQMDRVLFFGTDPWVVSFALFGSPLASSVINFFYHLWFFVLYFTVFAAAFGLGGAALRLRFLYAFVLTWMVGGNILAIVFSSAGPVYFERLGLGADFAPQMDLLRTFADQVPIWALEVQEELWTSYIGGESNVSGISAMPSMHVASSVLFALFGFSVNRWLGAALAAFAGIILVGSVHLGWHYLVDGLFGGIVTLAMWRAAGWLAARDMRRSAS